MDDGSKNSQGVTLIIMPKSQDLRFVLFPGHLPDSLLLSLELISYLKVICAQSWQHIEALWDLRSPKICPKLASFLKQIEKKHPVVYWQPRVRLFSLNIETKLAGLLDYRAGSRGFLVSPEHFITPGKQLSLNIPVTVYPDYCLSSVLPPLHPDLISSQFPSDIFQI